MNRKAFTVVGLLALFLAGSSVFAQYVYPPSKTVDVSDNYFGTLVYDPYRWLEDTKDSTVLRWFKEQADYTNAQLAKIPGQNRLIDELQSVDKGRSVYMVPLRKAEGRYFYLKRLPGEQVMKLYYQDGFAGDEILLFDPQKYAEGKTYEFGADVSADGSRVLLNLSEAGSELGDIRIIDVESKKLLDDMIPHSNGMFVAGSPTDIYYTNYKSYDTHHPENNLNLPFKLHIIGTPVTEDKTIVSVAQNPELKLLPRDYPLIVAYENSPHMILMKATVERNQNLYTAPLSALRSSKINWKPIVTEADEVRNFFANGDDLYLVTSKNNPRFSLIKTSLLNPDLNKAEIIVEGNEEWQLNPDRVMQTKDYVLISQTKNELQAKGYAYDMRNGQLKEIVLPIKGNIYAMDLSKKDNEIFIINSGWTSPYNFYSYDLDSDQLSDGIFHMKYDYPQMGNLVYEEVEVPSHDNALVPLSLIYDKNKTKKDGSNTVYMTGYGAYGMSFTPVFIETMLPLINRGVIIAFAHVRGGGEKGNAWYAAGKKETKSNTWKDFNACTQWLIDNKYTSANKMAVHGASAGGILIGRAITERPDLYRVAIPMVGCLNALRMEFSPNGPANIPEFGTVEDPADFKALYEMDAYQKIREGTSYPAQLITTGFNDPRVESYIPAKFAAKMQKNNQSNHPVFLDVDFKSGHFGGLTRDELFAQMAKEYAFVLWQTGHSDFQPE